MVGIPYTGKLSREKTLTNFVVLEPPTKVFSTKFGHAIATYMYDRFQHSVKVFSAKCSLLLIREILSLESFPLYGNTQDASLLDFCRTLLLENMVQGCILSIMPIILAYVHFDHIIPTCTQLCNIYDCLFSMHSSCVHIYSHLQHYACDNTC